MSEAQSPWRASTPPLFRPEMMIGAATPLWGYFVGAALSGVALWWMMRWMSMPTLQAEVEAMAETASEVLAEAVGGPVGEALVSPESPRLPVGGEAAPISPAVLEAALLADPGLEAKLGEEPKPPPRPRRPKEGEAKLH